MHDNVCHTQIPKEKGEHIYVCVDYFPIESFYYKVVNPLLRKESHTR